MQSALQKKLILMVSTMKSGNVNMAFPTLFSFTNVTEILNNQESLFSTRGI